VADGLLSSDVQSRCCFWCETAGRLRLRDSMLRIRLGTGKIAQMKAGFDPISQDRVSCRVSWKRIKGRKWGPSYPFPALSPRFCGR